MLWQPAQVIQGRYQLRSLKRDRPGHQVWLAQDQQSQAPVIIKTLAFTGEIQWDEVKLFEREIEILQRLDHPQIPAYIDAFTQEHPHYCKCLVEQYIHAPSLQAFLERHQRIPTPQIWSISRQILSILHHLHQGQPRVIHRDLKPSNILIDAQKTVYLIDLGTAGGPPNPARIDTPTTVGSYGYTPLEQFMGQAVPASDLYALGATLMHLLTQAHPSELLNSAMRLGLPPDLEISAPLKQWLYRLTAPQVSDRLATAELAQASLDQAQKHDQMLDQGAVRSRVSVNPDLATIDVQPAWNQETIATKDQLMLIGLSLVPLVLGSMGAIAAVNQTSGVRLLGTEMLIVLVSLLPTGLVWPRLFWKVVHQSITCTDSDIRMQWTIGGIRVRQRILPRGDMATLRISPDRSQTWQLSQVHAPDLPRPLVRRLQGHDVALVYQAIEHGWGS